MMKQLDRNSFTANMKAGQATRGGFGAEIELTAQGGNPNAVIDVDSPDVVVKVKEEDNAKMIPHVDTEEEFDEFEHLDEEDTQAAKSKKAITYIVFTITRIILFLCFTALAFIPPIFSGFFLLPAWAACLMTFFIFVLAISFDKASKSSRASCCGRLCHCCQAFNEFKLEAYIVIFVSLILTVFAQLFFGESCIVFGKSQYGINGMMFGQEFTYSSAVLRKFTSYPDPCDKYNFCHMYLTLPNTPFNPGNNMVINLFSKFPARQSQYNTYYDAMTKPDVDFKTKEHYKK